MRSLGDDPSFLAEIHGPRRDCACLSQAPVPEGDTLTREYEAGVGPVTLGRSSENDIQLQDSSVSYRHATITLENGNIYSVTDTGSTNGVRVNGASIKKSDLKSGDEIQLGNTTVRVVIEKFS